MSSRVKRKLEAFDPNASDPEDGDWDAREARQTPQRRRHRPTAGSKRKGPKRPRRGYNGSDVDNDDDIVTDDSFTDRSSSEEVEINPNTGRSVRRATKKEIKYEEDSDEDEIEDTPSEDDEDDIPRRRNKKPELKPEDKPSLVVKLKMPKESLGRVLRTRTGSKSVARGKTPDFTGARRSSRLSHDVEAPIVALSDSGKHVNIVRQGTRSPEPVISRATRGGKGPMTEHPSAIMEASQEVSMVHNENSPGPLDELLGDHETQVQASHEASPEHEAHVQKDNDADDNDDDDEEMEGVIQESQHEGAAEESEEEGPITRGGRNLRVSLLVT